MAYLYWIRLPEHVDMFSQGYIGITVRKVSTRWSAHKTAAKDESKQHLPIYKALNKYGADNLLVDVIIEGSEEYVLLMEERLRPTEGIGWNCAQGGQDTGKGRTQSVEEKQKRADKLRGRKHTKDARQRMSDATKGKPKSEAHKAKCRVAALGKKRPVEASRRQAEKLKGLVKITEEGRKRLSESKKSLNEWEHSQANKNLWSQAHSALDFKNSSEKFSQRYLAKFFGIKDSQVYALYTKLKSGWNPSEDQSYLAWLEQYKKEKHGA